MSILKKERMRILFDLECTCWDDKDFQTKNTEIIEIGAVRFDCKSFEIKDTFQTFVKPRIVPQLSEYCTNLTSIEQKDVDNAVSFPVAFQNFMKWAGDCQLFIGWGAFDRDELARNCRMWSDDLRCFPERKYLNGKKLYTYFTGIRGGGLKKRLTTEKLDFQGRQHRALDDSLMTLELLKKVWFDF